MTEQPSSMSCPRCGEKSTGRFCVGCGAPLRDVKCEACGTQAVSGSRFCSDCGAPLGAAHAVASASRGDGSTSLAKLIGGAAVLVLVAFVLGNATARRSDPASGGALASADQGAPANIPLNGAGITPAPDISSMSPEERASRLFNRVMLYSENGKMDSARFFAPMAIQAYQMIGPVDAHMRYDIGEISAAVGDASRARAEADTILAAQPKHLLGLVLAIRAAELSKDTKAAAQFRQRLAAAAPAERATGLKEYTEHSRDIDDALKKGGAP